MKIKKDVYESILSQARAELPDESCGYLLGSNGVVTVNHAMTNIDHSPEHFSFDPQEQFNVLRYARKEKLEVIGNWHSHPNSPSRPSIEDIRLAYDPTIAYAILSLAGEEPVFKAFRITEGEVENIPLEIID
ncbi:M67 family metallopeptidase [Parabacteroides sp. Marseille-P3160]|uniref:M67 family metallopeptidase n=1 Tax=Parabacteroides sp. Marseille-P3160 TaxID=1917887 RepID=UPI0009B94222|nr:M67 family metallopeptidase [Parabacteroides sp. Marseille-P3160]